MGGRNTRIWLVAGLLLAAWLTVPAWWPGETSTEDVDPPGTRVDFPDGSVAVIAWLPDGDLYVDWTPDLGATPYALMRVKPGQPAEPVDLPDETGCRLTRYLLPQRLPDSRLGLARRCITDDPGTGGFTLVAYDPITRRVEDLTRVHENLPTNVSWQRDMQSGYLSHGSDICDGFAPITRQGIGQLPGPITLDGHSWRLDEVFRQSGADSCHDEGRAAWATLTPDGRHLIFEAAPDAQGHDGWSRMDVPSHLYRQDLPDGQPRKLASSFTDVIGIEISPDGAHLAAAGTRNQKRGLWLIDLNSGQSRKIVDGPLKYPTFSPDGRRLAVVYQPEKDVEKAQLRIVDVPA